jgi:hypothetical protein
MHRAREWLARKNQCAVKSRESPVGERNKPTREIGLRRDQVDNRGSAGVAWKPMADLRVFSWELPLLSHL